MTRFRTTLHRLLTGTVQPADAGVHFHRRTGVTEVCHDAGCRLPRHSA